MADAASLPASPETLTFEQALTRLESLVHDLEEGHIGLAEGLARYEEGIKLLRQCYELLENAERRIELLSKLGAAGEALTEPFDEGRQSLEEKSGQRSRRRSRKTSQPPAEQPMQSGENLRPDGGTGSLF